ncbi:MULTISPECIES: DNA polymerase III subunit beta [Jonquetella]|uniref:Beta sliding clamp n=1 Tax=Jonquetella anthropi DSM 22815 TaxID=885272 RepID=H0ULH4_9BACT|nr:MULTISPECIES: DNA polymerase III subunit beta [Jonquetella]EHM12439.1 DNA polymerase III, beta subunit [Jonquetella anthropi DSM 22815]ERL24782.1 DNA polymerase III, beta subunit [Jonquetella sp. BV3C21]
MKLQLNRLQFLKAWQMAERTTNSRVPQTSLYSVHIRCGQDGTFLEATDLKTSISVAAEGVQVVEEGAALLPVRVIGELLKKIDSEVVELSVTQERGMLVAGKNQYDVAVFPTDLFPDMPRPSSDEPFALVPSGELIRVLDEGIVAGSVSEEFPRYIGACQLQCQKGELRAVSTDGRRLSLSKCLCESGTDGSVLVPLAPMKEFQRFLQSVESDATVRVFTDQALVHFCLPGLEYSVRRIESSFPNYEKVLRKDFTSTLTVNRGLFIGALERVDLLVRENNHLVVVTLSPSGEMTLVGRSPEVGKACEHLSGMITGESLKAAFNANYMLDGLRAFHGDEVYMTFNGSNGQMNMMRPGSDTFLYMLMPVNLQQSEYED